MTAMYSPSSASKHIVRLRLVNQGVDLTRWSSFQFASNFLTPTDAWSCTVEGLYLGEKERGAIQIGEEVRAYIDDKPLAAGRIDAVEVGDTSIRISGRDKLAAVVDSVADPRTEFKDGTTLAEFLKQIFAPYGWSTDDHFEIDNAANRDAKTGGVHSINTLTKSGKVKSAKALAKIKLHLLKPHNNEGLFKFASRVAERFGLYIWCSADGEKLIVGAPDYTQEPKYQLRRNSTGTTNILPDGTVRFDGTDQASVIIADGRSGGGEFGRGKMKAYCVNPYFGFDAENITYPSVVTILRTCPDAEPVAFFTEPFPNRTVEGPPRPVFLHDEDSKTPDELRFFVKRAMSELIRRSLVCNYHVEGLGQYVDGTFVPWDVDTVVDVRDEIAGVYERMYVLGRAFEVSRSGSMKTSLELVRLYSIAVPDEKPEPAKPKVSPFGQLS